MVNAISSIIGLSSMCLELSRKSSAISSFLINSYSESLIKWIENPIDCICIIVYYPFEE